MSTIKSKLKNLVGENTARRLKRWAGKPKTVASSFGEWMKRPNLYRLGSAERVGAVYSAPSEMSIAERLFLYGLIRGMLPLRSLEIGTNHGGSAKIICGALEDLGRGKLVGIDPFPRITVPWRQFHNRFTLIQEKSPDAIAKAAEASGGPFEFVLVDGIHIYKQVKSEIAALLPFLADEAILLFHDAFHIGIAGAVTEAVKASDSLHDCGYPCRRPAVGVGHLAYGGFRMLRFSREPITDANKLVAAYCAENGKELPPTDPKMFDHDPWYCRTYEKCQYCKEREVAGTSS
jgi:predicted O-methyltransferase YrrM